MKKLIKYIKKSLVDILMILSIIITCLTTMSLNIYAGLYLIAISLAGLSIVIARYKTS